MKLLVLFSAPLVAVLALIFSVVIVLDPAAAPATAAACTPSTPSAIRGIRLHKQQLRAATQIIQVGRRLHVPPRGWVVGLATAMQESGLRPLPFGDRDSLGVFQQRSTWSTAEARLDPVRAAEMFYTGGQAGQSGLVDIKHWKRLAVTEAAQAVQRSAYPDAYARWEPLAVALVKRLAHIDASCHASGGWSSPLGNASYVLTAGFGDCGRHWSHCHTGQDFAVPTGTPVTSVGTGVVTFAGWDGAYGNAVHVLHADGVATWYAHLSQVDVEPGRRVGPGVVLGLAGATGNTTGPHLHFEVRLDASELRSGTPIDPLPWLQEHQIPRRNTN